MLIIINTSIIKEHINLLWHSFVTPKPYPQGLTHNNNMKLRKKKYKPKVLPTSLYIFERRTEWIIISIHELQAISITPHITL
jgi:hypothetical protein